MNMKVLYTFLGKSDWMAPSGSDHRRGPVADAVCHLANERQLTHAVLLLEDSRVQEGGSYLTWLRQQLEAQGTRLDVVLRPVPIPDPTRFDVIYRVLRESIVENEQGQRVSRRVYLVGPGTPTMAACTLVVSRLRACEGELWQTDERQRPAGCRPLELPFALSLQDAPDPTSLAVYEQAPGVQTERMRLESRVIRSPSTVRVFQRAARAAKSNWPVLILGPTGSGKEELAKYLHEQRGQGRFMAVNCAAIPEPLLESELFGHKKGAFTGAVQDTPGFFEAAGDGTLFLDEIGEMPLSAQVRLLRVLQERKVTRVGDHKEIPVNCRVVAATHRDLLQMVREGRFREDLYYRLANIILRLEPLVRRPDDLDGLIERFWAQVVQENPGFPGQILTPEARARLLEHSWPGNVRELRAVLVRAAFEAQGPLVGRREIDLALGEPVSAPPAVQTAADGPVQPLKTALAAFRQQLARRALAQAGGNKSQAARLLGITPQHLARLLHD
jgi:DNA-binding NtrC family response regulator